MLRFPISQGWKMTVVDKKRLSTYFVYVVYVYMVNRKPEMSKKIYPTPKYRYHLIKDIAVIILIITKNKI